MVDAYVNIQFATKFLNVKTVDSVTIQSFHISFCFVNNRFAMNFQENIRVGCIELWKHKVERKQKTNCHMNTFL